MSDSPSHLLDVAESVGKINESIMDEIPDVVIDIRHKLIEDGERSETIRDSMTQLYNWKGEAQRTRKSMVGRFLPGTSKKIHRLAGKRYDIIQTRKRLDSLMRAD
ncbi:hypothetical protein KIS4809_2577 [Bacillus sp. ZZV12-4809]|nr:hypothetical protein KIS4809_2577 [Bacillus sp. ZZV12-4809]